MFVQPAITIEGRSQFQVSAGGASEPLSAGVYDCWAAADTYIRVSADPLTPAPSSSNGYLISAGHAIPVRIGRDGLKIGSSAALSFHRVE